MSDLVAMAHRVVNEPWGVGDPILIANSESWAPYLRFLHNIVKEYQPDVVLECGVYMGTATRHMALGNKNTLVIGIDRDFHPDVGKNVASNIVLMQSDTTNLLAEGMYKNLVFKPQGGRLELELLFLDSTHDGDTPRQEMITWSNYFGEECLVVCDDLLGPEHLKQKMQEFWRWLPGERQELHFLHPKQGDIDEPGFGISIVRRTGLRDD